jgi:hypothetical protein
MLEVAGLLKSYIQFCALSVFTMSNGAPQLENIMTFLPLPPKGLQHAQALLNVFISLPLPLV